MCDPSPPSSDEAANYDEKHEKAAAEIARRIGARRGFIGVPWIEDDDSEEDGKSETDAEPARAVRVLDYACGTGAMSRSFAPYTTQCIGIDLSQKMVDTYNTRASNQGLARNEMFAYNGNLCIPDDEDPEVFRDPEFWDFDMAIVGLGFHHFDDPLLAAKRLVSRLKPGGVLVIVDFLTHAPIAGHGHGHAHDHHHVLKALQTVTHHGFGEAQIREIFVDAGAGKDFAIDKMGEVTMGVKLGKRGLFMARGTKG
ncbi:S-adenosyl-L-methionine-dependent methyltransferase [Cryphonectria parasitica EP155]|uniref:S-adenosyl-L-methionine-dependent methyltransferase n=1 Tax=Cryphonectria parasitica (strain ATCC 38755 / EP155) TaxID=660469 RepID=A0A9P4XQN0_CRYP1|nr:S-adenosyl-L-methionine-dependent methyltransferase [Cryphonectria parasitica EP155]KAF3759937.1 S-adenosyl-L-methionine-dependent methyltransferase [Cryphonectria parasitica EP155]